MPSPQTTANLTPAKRIVLFLGGLTARMGYKQQMQVATFADWMFHVCFVASYAIGWYLERFSITMYGMLSCGLICLVFMVPNWSSAYQSAKAGRIVTGMDELKFLPRKTVRKYYKELRKDELRVEPTRKAPMRFPEE